MTDIPNQTAILKGAIREAAVAAAEIPPMRNRDQATAAVASFLRALPGVIVFEWLKDGASVGMGTASDLANKVEAINNER